MTPLSDQLIPPPHSRHPANLVPGKVWIWYSNSVITVLRRDLLNIASGVKICDIHAGTFATDDTEAIARVMDDWSGSRK